MVRCQDAPKRKIPAWAQGTAFKAALQRQFTQKIDVAGIFPATSPPDLCKIFPMKKRPRCVLSMLSMLSVLLASSLCPASLSFKEVREDTIARPFNVLRWPQMDARADCVCSYKERTSSAQWAPSPSHPGKLTAL
jgi:hypothetical protein